MDRGERRFQGECARVRRLYLLYRYFGRHMWEYVEERPWRALSNMGGYLMRDPGRWEREMMIRPARNKAKNMMRNGEYENLPNFRKPVKYYW